MTRLFLCACAVLVGASVAFASDSATSHEGKKIPPAPYYYVLDEPGVLNAQAKQALVTLLIEHDRLTGEQVLVAIFKSLDGEDLVDYTNRVFGEWKIGQKDKDNGILLALYWNDHKARIEVGYGLEDTLTDAKSKLILTNVLFPELRNGNPDRAVSLAALEILGTLGSPLIQNGKAAMILRGGGFTGQFAPQASAVQGPHTGTWPWFAAAFILMILVLNFFSSAEAHFTSGGLHSPGPLDYYKIRRPVLGPMIGTSSLGGWGGFFGGWGGGGFGSGGGGGGFGGFIGGGGSSGGGGASGGW